MTSRDPLDYGWRGDLIAHGWHRLGQSWLHHSHDNANGDTAFYTLAAAIRTELAQHPTEQ